MRTSNPKHHCQQQLASGPLLPTFARVPSANKMRMLQAAGDIIDWITDAAQRATCVLALGQETGFYGSQLLIHKLPTLPTAATPTAVVPAAPAPTTAAAAWRRGRRGRNPDLTTAAAAAAPTGVVPTATTPAATTPTPTATAPGAAAPPSACRTNERWTNEEAVCFSVGRNGGGGKCEGRCKHDGYPA
jgi:hypothetical protein